MKQAFIASLLYIVLASFVPAPVNTIKPASVKNSARYELPAALKLFPRQVVAPQRKDYVTLSKECGFFRITNASAVNPARVITHTCDGVVIELFIEPGGEILTDCLNTNPIRFDVVEGAIQIPWFLQLCS